MNLSLDERIEILIWHVGNPGLIVTLNEGSSLSLSLSESSSLSSSFSLSFLLSFLLGSEFSLLGSNVCLLSCLSSGNDWVLWISFLGSLSSLNDSFLLLFLLLDLSEVLLESRQVRLWFWVGDWIGLNWLWLINDRGNLDSDFLEGTNLSALLLNNILELRLELLKLGALVLLLFTLIIFFAL